MNDHINQYYQQGTPVNVWADHAPTALIQMPDIGELGEQLVAGWLQAQDWVILHHRWRCRWGEIDLIAQREGRGSKGKLKSGGVREFAPITPSPLLAFVEVKTRSRGNWDADGLLAITPQKQAKLWQTAQMFLAERPDLANLPCRFDVALVSYQRVSQGSRCDRTDFSCSSETMGKAIQVPLIQLGQPIFLPGYRLILQDYIQSAFD